MDSNYELKYHSLEENYWWFKSRRNIITQQLINLNISSSAKILEIGCSGGALLNQLKSLGYTDLHGIDISKSAIELSIQRGVANTHEMDAIDLNFDSSYFDVVIASDILEHIEDDSKALEEWKRVLKDKGCLILYVPALKSLWSNHDEINHHFRRYEKNQFKKLLISSGFHLTKLSFWNFTLFFPSYIIRKIQNLKKDDAKDQLYKMNSTLNSILILLLNFESFVLKKINFPIGISLFAICKKR